MANKKFTEEEMKHLGASPCQGACPSRRTSTKVAVQERHHRWRTRETTVPGSHSHQTEPAAARSGVYPQGDGQKRR